MAEDIDYSWIVDNFAPSDPLQARMLERLDLLQYDYNLSPHGHPSPYRKGSTGCNFMQRCFSMAAQGIPLSAANTGMFQGGSGNALNNSTANVASRDVWNVKKDYHIHLPQASHSAAGHGYPSFPQPNQDHRDNYPCFIPNDTFTYGLQRDQAQYTMTPSNPPTGTVVSPSGHGAPLGLGIGGQGGTMGRGVDYRHNGTVDYETRNLHQVSRPNVIPPRTPFSSHKRRKQDARFVHPLPGCGSTCPKRFNLKGHIRSHQDEKPFVCHWPECNKGFARQRDRKRHEQLHINHRLFTCEGCSRQFARMDALNRHLLSDEGEECAKWQYERAKLINNLRMGTRIISDFPANASESIACEGFGGS
ncbi:hypothetical protein BKA70DRAFT_725422 [Coprinopsis sp. MPI-PUGE-AT-0042]|nr:hypothetical protein BKA70DRAFT_725422 [Coprinopsis sp. MPI-PUGE-AT-0042]